MPRFRFRLQSVLDVRERVLDERRRVLAAAQRDLAEAQVERDALEADRESQRGALLRDHRSFDVDALRATYAHLAYLDRTIEEHDVRVAACADEVERAQAKLVAANTDRKVLETLRERRRESFNAEAAQSEQRETDDQNARRYGRAQHLGEQ